MVCMCTMLVWIFMEVVRVANTGTQDAAAVLSYMNTFK